jgi:hypothetical protein
MKKRIATGAVIALVAYKLRHIAFLAVLVGLCSCDASFFGPDLREIAGGYRLKRAGNPNQFSLLIPNQSGGLIVDEIGWRKPIIVARGTGSEYWDVINTARAEHTTVSDLERKSDPVYQSIEITHVDIAWRELRANKRLW